MAVTAFDPDIKPTQYSVTTEPSDGSFTCELTAWKYFGAEPTMLRANFNLGESATPTDIESELNDIITAWNALTAPP